MEGGCEEKSRSQHPFRRDLIVPKMIIDAALQAKFHNVDEAVLCDESGQPLGHFLSEEVYHRLLYDWANAQITDEELQRRLQEPGGRILAEIWARLENS